VATKTKATKKQTTKKDTPNIPTAQLYLAALDRLADLPEHVRETRAWENAYIDLWLSFFLHHPNEATPILRIVLPKARSFSNESVRALGQMSAQAFPDASFPFLTFSESGKHPTKSVREWFEKTVVPAAALAWMKSHFGRLVYLGLWSLMRNQEDLCRGEDIGEAVEACSNRVWTWASRPENAISLIRDRESKPSRIGSRLKAYARDNIARSWKTLSLRAHHKEPPILTVADPEQPIERSTLPNVASGVLVGGASLDEQRPKTVKAFCAPCASLITVIAEAKNTLNLACGHTRSVSSPGIAK
jgi:hypothetical protein